MATTNLIKRGGVYYARLWIRGREVRRSLRTGDRATARARLKEIREQAERAQLGLGPKETPKRWQDAVLHFTDLHLPGLRPATAARYQVSLRQLNPALRDMLLADINQGTLSAYAARRMREGASPPTVRRDLSTAALVLRAARRAGWVTGPNPALEEMSEIKERREVIRPVRMKDLARARRLARKEGKAMAFVLFGFLVRVGCRLEEAASIDWEDLALDAQPPTATFVKTKTRNPRTVELAPQVVRELRMLDRPRGCTYVFHRRDVRTGKTERYAKPDDLLSALVARGVGGAGVASGSARPFRIHDLRHTHAVRQLTWPIPAAGEPPPPWRRRMSVFDLARRLGHRQVSTTEGYTRWLSQRPDGWMSER